MFETLLSLHESQLYDGAFRLRLSWKTTVQLPDFKLERFFAKHEFSIKHLMCASDCEAMSIGELLAFEPDAEARFKEQWLGYTESPGSPTLRQEIANIYTGIEADDILVFTGAEEAIFLFAQGMLSKSDHAIIHWPCYQSLFAVAEDCCGSVDRWTASAENGWRLDLNELKDLLRPNTRAIVINSPHNPTGWLMSVDDWKQLHALAAERGILVFCDEVYRESEYDVADRLPAGCEMGECGISLGVMSKTYGLAGLRIGWVATKNTAVRTKLAALKDYTTICNSAPSEFLAELGLRNRHRLVERNLGLIERNVQLLEAFFSRHSERFSWVKPKAGAIAFPKLLGEQPIDLFCEQLVNEAGVLLAPGTMFNDHGNHFRIGFGRTDFELGLSALETYLG